MGIGNAAVTGQTTEEFVDSLPLMGIGNRAASALWTVLLLVLITPHGDRKPVDRRDVDAVLIALITPHGDRKPPSRRRRPPLPAPHYPSWGSETRLQALLDPRGSIDSLPLMGIGNAIAAFATTSKVSVSHYPSWGSETSQVGAT